MESSHEVYIKQEPWCPTDTLATVESEEPPDISNLKVEVKVEHSWVESPSELCDSDVKWKNEIKEPDEVAEGTSRMYTDTMCRNSDSFYNSTNSGENSCGNNDLETSQLLNSNQQQMVQEPQTSPLLVADVKGSKFKRFPCDTCGKRFSLAKDLKRHKLVHEDIRAFKCDVCEKRFRFLSDLKRHSTNHTDKKTFHCDKCEKSFTLAYYLKRHKQVHEAVRAFKCEKCEKRFARASHLRQHQLIHEGIRPHTCDICNKSFTQGSYLKVHKLIHDGKRPYTCDICNKNFTQTSALKRHKLTHEERKTPDV